MRSTIKKYLSGNSSEKEKKALLEWIRQENHFAEFQEVKQEWQNQIRDENVPLEYHRNWQNIQDTIFGRMKLNIQQTHRKLIFFKYAALLIALISIPSLFYFFSKTVPSGPIAYTTVSADFGQISKVLLPDSSVIWINSGSRIRYNNQFSSTNRNIELIGEAYFKVHKNKDLPLVVNCEDLRVKVLGTEFNVVSYPENNSIEVILEKGKVELSSVTYQKFNQVMTPGELASYNKSKNELSLSKVNTSLYTSWKDGLINIYNLPLSELVIRLEKRFNQKFIVDEAIKNLPYTFTIKNENLHTILSLMEKITPVSAIQRGNIIELKYNKTKIGK